MDQAGDGGRKNYIGRLPNGIKGAEKTGVRSLKELRHGRNQMFLRFLILCGIGRKEWDIMIKAVLFDMDGVLIDTEKYLTRFWQEVAREAGLEMELTECYLFRGFASKFASAFREKYGDSYDYYAILKQKKRANEGASEEKWD